MQHLDRFRTRQQAVRALGVEGFVTEAVRDARRSVLPSADQAPGPRAGTAHDAPPGTLRPEPAGGAL